MLGAVAGLHVEAGPTVDRLAVGPVVVPAFLGPEVEHLA